MYSVKILPVIFTVVLKIKKKLILYIYIYSNEALIF